MEITVNGKKVTLRDKFPVREFDGVFEKFGNLTGRPWGEQAEIFRKFVTAWEFDGDPSDIESWGNLDQFELLPLQQGIAEYITSRLGAAKN